MQTKQKRIIEKTISGNFDLEFRVTEEGRIRRKKYDNNK